MLAQQHTSSTKNDFHLSFGMSVNGKQRYCHQVLLATLPCPIKSSDGRVTADSEQNNITVRNITSKDFEPAIAPAGSRISTVRSTGKEAMPTLTTTKQSSPLKRFDKAGLDNQIICVYFVAGKRLVRAEGCLSFRALFTSKLAQAVS